MFFFHYDAIEEPFWVPQNTVTLAILKRTMKMEPFSTIKNILCNEECPLMLKVFHGTTDANKTP